MAGDWRFRLWLSVFLKFLMFLKNPADRKGNDTSLAISPIGPNRLLRNWATVRITPWRPSALMPSLRQERQRPFLRLVFAPPASTLLSTSVLRRWVRLGALLPPPATEFLRRAPIPDARLAAVVNSDTSLNTSPGFPSRCGLSLGGDLNLRIGQRGKLIEYLRGAERANRRLEELRSGARISPFSVPRKK